MAPPFLLLLLLAAFLFGVVQLFMLRFEEGDIYNAYSSLRSDPMGTKAFYYSLDNLPGLSVSRHYQPLHKLNTTRGTTLFYCGSSEVPWRFMPEDSVKTFEALASHGGRVVVTFLPARSQAPPADSKKTETPAPENGSPYSDPSPKPPSTKDDKAGGRRLPVSMPERWGFAFARTFRAPLSEDAPPPLAVKVGAGEDAKPIPWHSARYFTSLDENWRVVYTRDNQPVLIERDFGSGTIVLASDSYFLSNEALQRDRQTELLAWLVGPHARVVFDESHLNVTESPGIAALARKYRLHGLLAGLLLLAGLFVWKNLLTFVPPYQDPDRNDVRAQVSGKAAAAGFANLLRRSIAPANLLAVCFEEWKKSFARSRTDGGRKIERVQAVVDAENARPTKQRNPVAGYRDISKILSERK